MEEFNDDDFSDLYGDVEVQASSAISAMHVLTEMPLGDHGIFNHAMDGFPRLLDDEDDIFENAVGGENGEEGNRFTETENSTGYGGIQENATGVEEVEAEEKDESGGGGGLTKLPMENVDNYESGSESEDDLNIVLNGCGDGNKQQIEGNNSNFNNFSNGIKFGVMNGKRKHEGGEKNEQVENKNEEGIYGREKNFLNGEDYDSQGKYIRHHPFAFPSNLRGNGPGDEDNGCGHVMDESPVVGKSATNFSLPRSRTIFDVNIDSFERKPWRHPKSDITNFFNYGFDEDGWKSYCSDVDQYREQKMLANRVLALKFSRHNKEYEVGSEHDEVTQDPVGKNTANSRKAKRSSPTIKSYHRGHLSELPRGSSIRSDDKIGKCEPLSDERHSIDRDADVVIPELKEDSLNSVKNTTHPMVKKVHESSQGRDADVADDTNLLCFSSASEDDQPSLGRNDDGGKIVSGRGSMHTLTCAPVSLGLDKYGSMLISDSEDDNHHEVSNCDPDGMTDTSDDTNRINASRISNNVPSAVGPESSKSDRSRQGPGFSCSPSPCAALSNDDRQKSHEHSKKYGHHLSKESISHSSKPNKRESSYHEKDGGPIGKELKQHKRSSHVHNLKTHLNDKDTSDEFVVRGHHDMHQPMTSREKQKAMISLDSNEKDMPYNKGSESLFAYFGGLFPDHHLGPAYMNNQYWNIHPSFRYEADWGNGHNVNENKNFLEKKRTKLDYEALEDDWYHNEKRYVMNMNPLNFDKTKRLTPKYSSYPVNRRATQFSHKENGMQFRRRRRGDNLSPLREHNNDFIKGKYRRYMPSNDRDRDHSNNRYDRNMPRGRRELENYGRGKRRFHSPRNSSDYSWRMENEDNMRCVKNRPFPFHSYKKPYYAGRGRFRGAAGQKSVFPERHVRGLWKEKQKESGRYGSSNKHFDTNEGLRYHHNNDHHNERRRHYQQSINSFNNNGSIKNHDHNHFIRRRHHQHSEGSQWIDEEYESRKSNDTMLGSPSYHFERISRNTKLDDRHADHVAELIGGREVDRCRYKLIREGGCSNQFDRSPKIIDHDDSHEQIHPRHQDSIDPQLVNVGEKCTLQSSRRTPKAEDAVYYDGRYDFMEWDDDDDEPEDFKDLNDFSPDEVVLSNEGMVDNADNQQNGFLDIEEGQIITVQTNGNHMERVENVTRVNELEHHETASNGNKLVDGLDDHRIQEIITKMEKRRERFKDPMTLNMDFENCSKYLSDLDVETAEDKIERPARIRTWVGTGDNMLVHQ